MSKVYSQKELYLKCLSFDDRIARGVALAWAFDRETEEFDVVSIAEAADKVETRWRNNETGDFDD